MLREGLRDRDIPHRTKIREAIIVAWKEYFASLKLELAVNECYLSFSNYSHYAHFRPLSGKSVSRVIYGPTPTYVHS
jgi:hypothetical protein